MTPTLRIAKLALFAAVFSSCPAFAQDAYPSHPVTIVAPSVSGGALDGMARVLADGLTTRLGQRFIVENRPGANFTIGTAMVAKAKPDGYTLLFAADTGLTVAPLLLKSVPYDATKDLAPVTLLGVLQFVLVAHPSLGVTTVRELIAAAKARPGGIQYASGGDGSPHHLAMEQFRLFAGINVSHVPYKAPPQGFRDLLGGHIPLMFIATGTAAPHVKERKIIALGLSGDQPVESLPGVPPISAAVPGYKFETWFGLFVPAKTPRNIVLSLNAETAAALRNPETALKLEALGVTPRTTTQGEFSAFIAADIERTKNVIRAAGIKGQ